MVKKKGDFRVRITHNANNPIKIPKLRVTKLLTGKKILNFPAEIG
jgi:hypothetical protein